MKRVLSRIQWSKPLYNKRGVEVRPERMTAYDMDGAFAFHLTEPWALRIMDMAVLSGLMQIEKKRQEEQNATVQKVQESGSGESGVRGIPGAGDAAGSPDEGEGHGEPKETPPAREDFEEEPLTPI